MRNLNWLSPAAETGKPGQGCVNEVRGLGRAYEGFEVGVEFTLARVFEFARESFEILGLVGFRPIDGYAGPASYLAVGDNDGAPVSFKKGMGMGEVPHDFSRMGGHVGGIASSGIPSFWERPNSGAFRPS